MDRSEVVPNTRRTGAGRGPGDDFLLPSRVAAVEAVRAGLEAGEGPVLLTGESGVGKSLICRSLRIQTPGSWRWATVEISPAIEPAELHRLILHSLGFDPVGRPAESRLTLENFLVESADDGTRWGLIVEEAQNATDGVLEELRVLGNRLGERGAFAGLLLVGQNSLARRLGMRRLSPLASRVSKRVHLRPITVEELSDWLAKLDPEGDWDEFGVERLHRDLSGNPRGVLGALAESRAWQSSKLPRVEPISASPKPRLAVSNEKPAATTEPEEETPWEVPPVVPTKPPLEVGDEMIEVGWEPTPMSDREAEDADEARLTGVLPSEGEQDAEALNTETVIDDHYAALQAWTEWAKNQDRVPIASEPTTLLATAEGDLSDDFEADEEESDEAAHPLPGHPGVWAEGQHAFAPYSQLFSRLRQSRDSR